MERTMTQNIKRERIFIDGVVVGHVFGSRGLFRAQCTAYQITREGRTKKIAIARLLAAIT